MPRPLEDRLHLAWCVALAAGAGCAFWVPALGATRGDWPAPLDDVLIHFDFARSAAELRPFQWIAGQGFSSGETSPLYPLVLAPGYLVGFRGLWLGAWAALVACASLVVLMRAVRELARPAPWWAAWLGAALLVAVGILDWTWFSGMEVALFGALVGRALVAVKRAREAPPWARARAQWRAGAWGAALVATRPEAAVLVAAFAVVAARRAGARSALAALARVALPGALVTLGVLAVNRALTGDAMSAGAILKLLSRNPYLSDVDRARELAVNLFFFRYKVLGGELSILPALWPLVPALALAALAARRTRGLSAACLAGALAWTLLVSWNGAARYQNYRYYMPALALLLVASALGVAALASARRARGVARPAGAALGCAAVLLALPTARAQIAYFSRAARNVHDQQIEVGRRLAARTPPGAVVMVGDAGAIPYVSRRHALDALGLGGYGGLPFARAATHGEGATIELVERLAPGERPRYMALYPNWFGQITSTFGREIDRVTIDDNVICGGPTKGIYLADWSALALPGERDAPARDGADGAVVDELDVADVISEGEHAYESPAPRGGWTTLATLQDPARGAPRFDAGRIVPEGREERFVARGAARGAWLALRTTDGAGEIEARVTRADGATSRAALAPQGAAGRADGAWRVLGARIPGGVAAGDRVTLRAARGEYRDFHVWLLESTSGAVPSPAEGETRARAE